MGRTHLAIVRTPPRKNAQNGNFALTIAATEPHTPLTSSKPVFVGSAQLADIAAWVIICEPRNGQDYALCDLWV